MKKKLSEQNIFIRFWLWFVPVEYKIDNKDLLGIGKSAFGNYYIIEEFKR